MIAIHFNSGYPGTLYTFHHTDAVWSRGLPGWIIVISYRSRVPNILSSISSNNHGWCSSGEKHEYHQDDPGW